MIKRSEVDKHCFMKTLAKCDDKKLIWFANSCGYSEFRVYDIRIGKTKVFGVDLNAAIDYYNTLYEPIEQDDIAEYRLYLKLKDKYSRYEE